MSSLLSLFQCSNCGFDVHKKFVQRVEETCVGPSKGSKSKNKKERGVSILPIPIGSSQLVPFISSCSSEASSRVFVSRLVSLSVLNVALL